MLTLFKHLQPAKPFTFMAMRAFTGKTETGHRYTTPYLKRIRCMPVYPPPGLNLKLPDWTPEEYLYKIGGDTYEHADKFETLEEVFTATSREMKAKEIPVRQRKYILRMKEMLRCGQLNFDYLSKRTHVKPCREI